MNLSAVLRRVWGCNESSCRCSSTVFCKTGTKKRIPHRRQVLADSRIHPEMIDDQHIRGANLCSWRHNRNKSRSSQNSRKIGPAAMVLALVLTLSGDLSSFGPTSVHGGSAAGTPGTITPAWEWGAQELYECAIPNRNLETQCECYSYNLNDNPPCLSNKPAEPEKRTMAVKKSVPRACTHAPGVQFRCMEPDKYVSLTPTFNFMSVGVFSFFQASQRVCFPDAFFPYLMQPPTSTPSFLPNIFCAVRTKTWSANAKKSVWISTLGGTAKSS